MSRSKSKAAALTMTILIAAIALSPTAVERSQSPPSVILHPIPTIPKPRFSLLVVGDSLSISLGEQLEQHFAKYSDRIEFQRLGKVSSGLARPDFFDWEQNLRELVSVWHPNIVVIMIGTNDNKPLKKDQRTLPFGSDAWRREYRSRLQRLYDICHSKSSSVRIIWVGAPVMKDSTLAQELRIINRTIESWCRTLPACEYISTWSTLADKDGKFLEALEDTETGKAVSIRARDGVHLAPHGSHLLANATLNAIQKHISFEIRAAR